MGTENKGKKYDQGKAPVYQGFISYFPRAIKQVALISKYGLDKYNLSYDDQNWARVESGFGRYSDALGRHLCDQCIEGFTDGESKLLHLAHDAWNAMARLEIFLRKERVENATDRTIEEVRDQLHSEVGGLSPERFVRSVRK